MGGGVERRKGPSTDGRGGSGLARSGRTLLPCPVGLRPLTVTGLIAAKEAKPKSLQYNRGWRECKRDG